MSSPIILPQPGDRALSVLQPWASIILTGLKPLENRTWSTEYRGPLWIHASKARTRRNDATGEELANVGLPLFKDMVFGAIIGRVTLTDCLPLEKLPPELREHWSCEGPICWVVSEPILLAEPIPMKGAMSLWRIPKPTTTATNPEA